MKIVCRTAAFGLVWLAFAAAAFGANSKAIVHPVPEPGLYLVTGVFLVLLGLVPRRRKQ